MKHKIKLATRTVAILALVFTVFSWNSEKLYAGSLNDGCPVAIDYWSCLDRAHCFYDQELRWCLAGVSWPDAPSVYDIEYCKAYSRAIKQKSVLDCWAFFIGT